MVCFPRGKTDTSLALPNNYSRVLVAHQSPSCIIPNSLIYLQKLYRQFLTWCSRVELEVRKEVFLWRSLTCQRRVSSTLKGRFWVPTILKSVAWPSSIFRKRIQPY